MPLPTPARAKPAPPVKAPVTAKKSPPAVPPTIAATPSKSPDYKKVKMEVPRPSICPSIAKTLVVDSPGPSPMKDIHPETAPVIGLINLVIFWF